MSEKNWIERALDPDAESTGTLPLEHAKLRCRPEDFQVEEIPAYEADGREDAHLLLTLQLKGMNTDFALKELARQLQIPRSEIGSAGIKDRHALTKQWISLPAAAKDRLASFSHPDMSLGTATGHGNKLRRGHLKGNRFRLSLREPQGPSAEDPGQVLLQLQALEQRGGLLNFFGRQRFGRDGRNLERGLALLRNPRRIRPGDLMLSALQSALFNLQILMREDRGMRDQVALGDLLKKRECVGLFPCEDPETDQQRLESGELCITASLPGSKNRKQPEDCLARNLEREAMEVLGLEPGAFASLGKKAPGAHREIRVSLGQLDCGPEAAVDELSAGLWLRFALPSGSFATRVLKEILVDWSEHPPRLEDEA